MIHWGTTFFFLMYIFSYDTVVNTSFLLIFCLKLLPPHLNGTVIAFIFMDILQFETQSISCCLAESRVIINKSYIRKT